VLSKSKLRALGVSIPHWKDALPRYLRERLQRNAHPSLTPATSS
jgi:hypothetical protein